MWEIHYLLAKIRVREIMTRPVVTTTPDTPVEDAARLMVAHKIGGLPVVGGGHVVGVITETNIFDTFVEMLSGGEPGLRLTLEVPEGKGILAALSSAIFELGGLIESVGSFYGPEAGERQLVIKVRDVSKEQLLGTLETLGTPVLDAREV
jgi:acetoin utilization protein AcuB